MLLEKANCHAENATLPAKRPSYGPLQSNVVMSIGEDMIETWRWLCDDPRFHNLPYRFELSRDGVIRLSPKLVCQARMKAEIAALLNRCRSDGAAFISLSTITPDAIYEVDVAWSLDGKRAKTQDFADPALNICIELHAKSNADPEFTRKKDAYFAAGAKEVWFVDREWNTTFYTCAGPITKSHLIPDFPSLIIKE